MKKWIFYIILFGNVCLAGCLDDKTVGPHIDISKITINMPDDTLFVVNIKDNLVLDALDFVSQTDSLKPLKFTWQGGVIQPNSGTTDILVRDSMFVLSREQVFNHNFTELNTYRCRLKVANEDYAVFKYFQVKVVTDFDEGLMVFSKNEAGEAMFSLLSAVSPSDLQKKSAENFWYVTSETEPILNQDIVDFNYFKGTGGKVKGNYFYLLSGTNKKAYMLDQYSLRAINSYPFSKTPKKLALINHGYGVLDLYAFTADGDVEAFCGKYNTSMGRYALDSIHHWDDAKIIKSRSDGFREASPMDMLYLFDDETSTMSAIICEDLSTTALRPKSYTGYEIVNVAFYNYGNGSSYNDVYVILREKANPKNIRIIVYNGYIRYHDFHSPSFKPSDTLDYTLPADENLSITRNSKMQYISYSQFRWHMIYNSKQKLYMWNPGQTLPSEKMAGGDRVFDVTQQVGQGVNSEIIDFDVDPTMTYVYILVWNPDTQQATIYSVWAFGFTQYPELHRVWTGFDSYKPVKLYYKANVTSNLYRW